MSRPASTLTHQHQCPAYCGLVPHVGGPITAGSPNVAFEGLPAARLNDSLICQGPNDLIATGSATVSINGLPAARIGDQTAHGGVIVAGCATVFIGG